MRATIFTVLSIIILALNSYAQKQDYVWPTGRDYQGIDEIKRGAIIDFNEKGAKFESGVIGYNFHSYSASICNENGRLLFYTNGCAVLDSTGSLAENGDSLNYNEWFEERWQGDCKRNGYPGTQDITILPFDEHRYVVVHKVKIYNGFAFEDSISINVSIVDVSENELSVLVKDSLLYEKGDLCVGYLTAIANAENVGFYILQPKVEDSLIVTYYLDETGFTELSNQNSGNFFTGYRSSASGTARFSPDGTKYAFYNYYDGLHIYDFDRSTGEISNHQEVVIFDSINVEDIRFGSMEWSADSRFIYTASRDELHQVDTWEPNLQDGVRLIDIYDGTQDPFATTFFLMALAPDCKIYMAATNGSFSYHVINNPDQLGTACNFVQNGIQLPPDVVGMPSFPNHPRWRVDEEDKCDPTITSIFGEAVYYRSELSVYPIPSSGIYTVDIPLQKSGVVHVTSIQGQILRSYEVASSARTITVDISDMPAGLYHVEYYPHDNKERQVYTRQVVRVE